MINFFRKIRQHLLVENKFTKYLLYALGEIILVVIGILIALSINNWNEERKIRNAEIEILRNLKSELNSNLVDLSTINELHKEEFENGIYLLNLFGTDISHISVNKLDSLTSNVLSGYSFEAKDGYIKSLISSNKIDYLKNAELKSYISSFESMILDANQEDGFVRRLLNERFWPATDGKLNALNGLATTGRYEEFPEGTYLSDYEWFFSNREMEDLLANIVAWRKENVLDEQVFKEKIDRMIQIIQAELKDK
ncbi:DUF6090 family protein [Algoriphagus halophilus]|uniref:Uncharacterized protein n=1 Tax=Algoriphagus halophilus TaxID=226505 RepID=A0A1N6H3X2_9BACT|nr:DUF6090 family protein [Algoriphagus halophilus]SIO14501.1 hypothetical protein SAMN05444394_3536 [Algoriphagus halophilus]